MANKKFKISYIADAKMVCILLVFLWHCMLFYEDNQYFEESVGIISPTATFIGNIFDITLISTFVFCSGYLYVLSLSNHNRSMLQSTGERVKRLIVPYYIIGTIWLVPFYTLLDIKAFGRPDGAGWAEGYKCMALGQFSDHLWFLWMLFWVTLFFILLTPLIRKNMMALMFVITVAAALCVDLFLGDFPYFKLSQIASYLICFYLGMLFCKYAVKIEALSKSIKITITLLLFAVLIVYAVLLPQHFAFKYVFRPAGALFFVFFFMLLSKNSIWSKIYKTKYYDTFIRHQMNIYLMHMPLPYVFSRILRPYIGHIPWLCILTSFILVVTCGMILAHISIWIEKKTMASVRKLYGYKNE